MQYRVGCIRGNKVMRKAVVVIGGLLCLSLVSCEQKAATDTRQPRQPTPAESAPASPLNTAGNESTVVESAADGPDAVASAAWSSPTHGTTWQLRYLPAGTPCILMWRPAAMYQCDGHELLFRALGSDYLWLTEDWRHRTGTAWEGITRLTVGLQPQDQGLPRPIVVAELDSEWQWPSWWETAQTLGTAPHFYRQHDGWCFYVPAEQGGRMLVMALPDDMPDVLLNAAVAPVLQRQLQQLLRDTDQDRHVTLLAVPSFFYADGRPLFRGVREAMPDLIHWLLGAELQGLSLSLHFDRYWFTELSLVPDITLPATQFAVQLRHHVEQIPRQIERYLEGVTVTEYWKKLAARMPAMVQFACDHVRIQVDSNNVRATMALPLPAAHNLLLSTDLALQSGMDSAAIQSDLSRNLSMDELLSTEFSFDVEQQSLEDVFQDLRHVVRGFGGARRLNDVHSPAGGLPLDFQIELQGDDLRRNGITKNQQIRSFHCESRALREILTRLVMRANPVTTVVTSADADQRLVWYVDRSAPRVWISTRSAVLERGEVLPVEFTDVNSAVTAP